MGHAVFTQRSDILGVAIVSECGIFSTQQIVTIGRLAEQFHCEEIKLTSRQNILCFVRSKDFVHFKAAIEEAGLSIGGFGNVVRNVKSCAGREDLCQFSQGDVARLGIQLQRMFMNQPVPRDFKISAAGCSHACTDPYCADFGIIAAGKNAFDIYLGGRGGSSKPQHGQRIAERMSADEVIELLDFVLVTYRQYGETGERLVDTIARCGLEKFL